MIQKFRKAAYAARFRLSAPKRPVIGLVVSSFDKGGLEQVVLNLYRGYRAAGYEAYLLVEENILGPMARQMPAEHLFVFDRDERKFLAFCREKNINTLHYHYNTFLMKGARLIGFRILYTIHNIYTWKNDAEMAAYAAKLQSAHRLVAVSGFVRDYFCARTGLPKERVEVINNGVQLDELFRPASLPFTRGSLGLKEGDIALAMVASFHPVKHQIGMLGVMRRLQARLPQAKLLLVGNVGDPEYYKEFCRHLQASPAAGSVIQVPYLNHTQMGEFLRTIPDLFLLPTLQEGCSNAVLEALCSGLPMVLTDVGNAREAEAAAPGACIVAPAAVPDPVQLTDRLARQLSGEENAPNADALADAICAAAADLPAMKAAARTAARNAAAFGCGAMCTAYLALMERR